MKITQQSLDSFKSQFPEDATIQALTLAEVLEDIKGKTIDWDSVVFKEAPGAGWEPTSTKCQFAIGYVMFDVICLALGAPVLRRRYHPNTVDEISVAVAYASSRIQAQILKMDKPGASPDDIATAAFEILQIAGFSVYQIFLDGLSGRDRSDYGFLIYDKVFNLKKATFIKEAVVLLGSFPDFARDVGRAEDICHPLPPLDYKNGWRIRDGRSGRIFLVLDGGLRYILNSMIYEHLFVDWTGIHEVRHLGEGYKSGPMIDWPVYLAKGTSDGKVFLLIDGMKRWITSPAVFNAYGFSWEKIRTEAADSLNRMPTGAPLY